MATATSYTKDAIDQKFVDLPDPTTEIGGELAKTFLVNRDLNSDSIGVLVLWASELVPEGLPSPTILIRKSVDPTVVLPERVGYAFTGTGESTVTVDTGAIDQGSWTLMSLMRTGAPTGLPGTIDGWTTLLAPKAVGTRCMAVYGRMADGSEGTSQTFDLSTPGSTNCAIAWGTGASDVSTWIVGTSFTRSGSSTTTTVPSITTSVANTLSIYIAGEASAATETEISSVTGATEWFFSKEPTPGAILETLNYGYIDAVTAGDTGDVTLVYPNTTGNGCGIQIGIPPAGSSV